jgi:hypothetical protein
MAMLIPSLRSRTPGCPVGICRRRTLIRARAIWKEMAAGFAAGASTVAVAVALVGGFPGPKASPLTADPEAAAARAAALMRDQAPRELPREWRWKLEAVDVDRMFRKQR